MILPESFKQNNVDISAPKCTQLWMWLMWIWLMKNKKASQNSQLVQVMTAIHCNLWNLIIQSWSPMFWITTCTLWNVLGWPQQQEGRGILLKMKIKIMVVMVMMTIYRENQEDTLQRSYCWCSEWFLKEKKVESRLSRFLGSGIDILDHDHSGMLNDEDGQNNW